MQQPLPQIKRICLSFWKDWINMSWIQRGMDSKHPEILKQLFFLSFDSSPKVQYVYLTESVWFLESGLCSRGRCWKMSQEQWNRKCNQGIWILAFRKSWWSGRSTLSWNDLIFSASDPLQFLKVCGGVWSQLPEITNLLSVVWVCGNSPWQRDPRTECYLQTLVHHADSPF